MSSSPLACDACPVRDRAACSALDDSERSDLARLGRHRTLQAGEVLFTADEHNDRDQLVWGVDLSRQARSEQADNRVMFSLGLGR
jgi:CRP/FNR family transcriptional regulator